MINFFDFKRRFRREGVFRRRFHQVLDRVLDNGYFILGPELANFEKKFAEYLSVPYVVGLNSGTDAIFLALKALGVGRGDEVITVANTATPTISAIRLTGATPIFVDIDPLTLTIDPRLIERVLSKKTKAIVPVHLFGQPAILYALMVFAKKYLLWLVEDVCQAHGAAWQGKKLGTLGDIGAFSFYPTKNLGTLGDGGAIATHNRKLAEKIRALRNYGEIAKFDNHFEGVNSRLDEIQAAWLSANLPDLDKDNQIRAQLAKLYLQNLAGLPLLLPKSDGADLGQRVWHLFVIRTKEREALREFLARRGVTTMIHYPRLVSDQVAYQAFKPVGPDCLPETRRASQEILSLPLYPELKVSEIKTVTKLIKQFFTQKT